MYRADFQEVHQRAFWYLNWSFNKGFLLADIIGYILELEFSEVEVLSSDAFSQVTLKTKKLYNLKLKLKNKSKVYESCKDSFSKTITPFTKAQLHNYLLESGFNFQVIGKDEKKRCLLQDKLLKEVKQKKSHTESKPPRYKGARQNIKFITFKYDMDLKRVHISFCNPALAIRYFLHLTECNEKFNRLYNYKPKYQVYTDASILRKSDRLQYDVTRVSMCYTPRGLVVDAKMTLTPNPKSKLEEVLTIYMAIKRLVAIGETDKCSLSNQTVIYTEVLQELQYLDGLRVDLTDNEEAINAIFKDVRQCVNGKGIVLKYVKAHQDMKDAGPFALGNDCVDRTTRLIRSGWVCIPVGLNPRTVIVNLNGAELTLSTTFKRLSKDVLAFKLKQ